MRVGKRKVGWGRSSSRSWRRAEVQEYVLGGGRIGGLGAALLCVAAASSLF
jgi:nitrous oxide reductase accessory protein NosL